jgi:hypothetical protein
MIDRKNRNRLIEELQLEAWHHSINGQKLLSRIRDLETLFKAQDVKEDKEQNETRTR